MNVNIEEKNFFFKCFSVLVQCIDEIYYKHEV